MEIHIVLENKNPEIGEPETSKLFFHPECHGNSKMKHSRYKPMSKVPSNDQNKNYFGLTSGQNDKIYHKEFSHTHSQKKNNFNMSAFKSTIDPNTLERITDINVKKVNLLFDTGII